MPTVFSNEIFPFGLNDRENECSNHTICIIFDCISCQKPFFSFCIFSNSSGVYTRISTGIPISRRSKNSLGRSIKGRFASFTMMRSISDQRCSFPQANEPKIYAAATFFPQVYDESFRAGQSCRNRGRKFSAGFFAGPGYGWLSASYIRMEIISMAPWQPRASSSPPTPGPSMPPQTPQTLSPPGRKAADRAGRFPTPGRRHPA